MFLEMISVKIESRYCMQGLRVLVLMLTIVVQPLRVVSAPSESFPWTDEDRILIVAPHPDDETIAAAGVIQEALSRHLPVRIVYLTNGDSNQLAFLYYRKALVLNGTQAVRMGELRQNEAIAAMKSLGLQEDQLVFLGYPDYGTLNIFKKFWKTQRPYRGVLTKARAVPYKRALRPGAPYTGEAMLTDFTNAVAEFRPTKIIVNHPADQNTDHQAAYLLTRLALWDLQGTLANVEIYSYLIHAIGWPRPFGYHPTLRLFPDDRLHLKSGQWSSFELTAEQIRGKYRAVGLYRSQIPYKPKYLYTFVRANELFSTIFDVALSAHTLDQAAWNALDETQQLKHKNKKIDVRYYRVLRSVTYGLDRRRLVAKVKLNQWSHLGFEINVYAFGYRQGQKFADRPKYRIRILDDNKIVVFNGQTRVKVDGCSVKRQGNDFYISIPLSMLDYPDRVMASAFVRVGHWPEEFSTWTVLRLEDGRSS